MANTKTKNVVRPGGILGNEDAPTTIGTIAGLRQRLAGGLFGGMQPCANRSNVPTSSLSVAADPSVSSRLKFTFPKAVTEIRLVYANWLCTSSSVEYGNVPNSIEIGAAFEYPKDIIMEATFNGQRRVTIPPNSTVISDPIPVDMLTDGQTGWARQFFKNNGSQQYPVVIQSLNDFSDSGRNGDNAGQVITGATNATPIVITTNGSHNLTTGDSVTIDAVLGNTAANGTFVCTVLTATTFSLNVSVGNGAYTSGGRLRGNDLTLSGSGLMYGNQGPLYYAPIAILGRFAGSKEWFTMTIVGDSIAVGSNDVGELSGGGGFFTRALTALGIPHNKVAVGGTGLTAWCIDSTFPKAAQRRQQMASQTRGVVCNFGTNDFTTQLYAVLQSQFIKLWQRFANGGQKILHTTILPKTTTSDAWATAGNQNYANPFTITVATNASPIAITTSASHWATTGETIEITGAGGNTAANGTWVVTVTGVNTLTLNGSTGNGAYTSGGLLHAPEAKRKLINTWLRDGAPMVAGVAVAPGTVGANRAGDGVHPVSIISDIAAVLEVNAANALTLNGGRWLCTGAANYATSDGTHPSTAIHIIADTVVRADVAKIID